MLFIKFESFEKKGTCKSARRRATERALVSGERESGERGKLWSMGIESLRALKSNLDELLDSTFILSVSSLKAPTSSTTIFSPAVEGNGAGEGANDDDDSALMECEFSLAAGIRRVRMLVKVLSFGILTLGIGCRTSIAIASLINPCNLTTVRNNTTQTTGCL